MKMKKQLIIGLGTGRCGTVSIYRLLNSQKSSNISHESMPVLSWEFNQRAIEKKLNSLMKKRGRYVGDVASYYLPYMKFILGRHPDVKFVCLKRNKKEVIESFDRHTKRWDFNHWIDHDGKKWKKSNKWDKSFPTYDIKSKKRAIARYWEEYYKEVKKLMKKYSRNIKIFKISALNTQKGVRRILDFCGIDRTDQKIIIQIKENKSGDKTFGPRYVLWKANKI